MKKFIRYSKTPPNPRMKKIPPASVVLKSADVLNEKARKDRKASNNTFKLA